jgi:hypothetical protein
MEVLLVTVTFEPVGAGRPAGGNSAHIAGFVGGEQISAKVQLSIRGGGEPTLVSSTGDIEVPLGSPILEHLLALATIGGFQYLTRNGRRVAAVIPADIAESLQAEPGDLDDGPDDGPLVTDPARLRGTPIPDYDEWQAAITAGRP